MTQEQVKTADILTAYNVLEALQAQHPFTHITLSFRVRGGTVNRFECYCSAATSVVDLPELDQNSALIFNNRWHCTSDGNPVIANSVRSELRTLQDTFGSYEQVVAAARLAKLALLQD